MPHVNALQIREYISPGSISTKVEQTDFILFECRRFSIKLKVLHSAERIVLPHNEDRVWRWFLINGNYEEEYLVIDKQATWPTPQTLYLRKRFTKRFIPRYTLFHKVIGVYGDKPALLLCIGGKQGKEPVKYMSMLNRKSYTADEYLKKLQQEREEILQHMRHVAFKHTPQVINKGVN